MSGHTKGRWISARAGLGCPAVYTEGVPFTGQPIAFLGVATSDGDVEVFDDAGANANLIAAAPDLLEALEALMGGDEKLQVGIGGNPHYVDAFIGNVRAIISKAKGEDNE